MNLVTAKLALNIVASLGVSKVVGDIVKNNTTVLTTSQKFLVNTGGLILGSMVVEQACNHVNTTFDQVLEWHRREKTEAAVEES